MLELINLFLYILLITFIGLHLLRLLTFNRAGLGIIEELAVSFGLGIGFVSLQMLLYYFLGLKFSIPVFIIPWIALPLLNAILFRNRARTEKLSGLSGKEAPWHKPLDIFLGGAIVLEISYAFFRALIKPIESYDAVAIYAIKSKIFYLAKSIPSDYFGQLARIFPHPDYPLNIPLFQAFIYTSISSLNDQLVKVIFPLFFLATLVLLYFAIRRIASSTYALLFTFILASIPQFNAYAANAYLDLPLAYYCFVSAIFLFRWLEDASKTQYLIISAVMAGLAGWTKNEGIMYCVIFLAMVASRRKLYSLVIYGAIISAISLPWLWLKYSHHIVNSDIGSLNTNPMNFVNQFYKLGPIVYEFQKHLFGQKKWNIFWLSAVIVFMLNFKRSFTGSVKHVSIALVLIVSGYIFFYLISPLEIGYFLSKTWSRFLIQFLPIAVYWTALMLKEDIKI